MIHGAYRDYDGHWAKSWINGSFLGYAENLYIRHVNHFSGIPLEGAVNFSNFVHPFSFHPAGAHASMCDGSVRHLAKDLSLDVLFSLATREVIEFAR